MRTNAKCIALEKGPAGVRGRRRLPGGLSRRSTARICSSPSAAVPNTNDLGLDRAGVKTDARGYIVVDDQLRTNVPGHLGARRLQRPGRLHAHRVQRLRDRRRESPGQGSAAGHRPHRNLRAVHRAAARPGRDDGDRGEGRPAEDPRRQAPDDEGQASRREGRDPGIHEGRRRRRREADPGRGDPRHRRRRGRSRDPRRDVRPRALHAHPAGDAHPPDRLGAICRRSSASSSRPDARARGCSASAQPGHDPERESDRDRVLEEGDRQVLAGRPRQTGRGTRTRRAFRRPRRSRRAIRPPASAPAVAPSAAPQSAPITIRAMNAGGALRLAVFGSLSLTSSPIAAIVKIQGVTAWPRNASGVPCELQPAQPGGPADGGRRRHRPQAGGDTDEKREHVEHWASSRCDRRDPTTRGGIGSVGRSPRRKDARRQTRRGRCAAMVSRLIVPHLQRRERVSPTLAPSSSLWTAEQRPQVHSTGRMVEPAKSCQKRMQLPRSGQPSCTVARPWSGPSARRMPATSMAEWRSQ